MNENLIRELKSEQQRLFPNGYPIQPRGSSKTYTYLALFLRWYAYNLMCQIYECMTGEVTLEMAHKDIDDFVISMMPD